MDHTEILHDSCFQDIVSNCVLRLFPRETIRLDRHAKRSLQKALSMDGMWVRNNVPTLNRAHALVWGMWRDTVRIAYMILYTCTCFFLLNSFPHAFCVCFQYPIVDAQRGTRSSAATLAAEACLVA